jgi:hypothetical protein
LNKVIKVFNGTIKTLNYLAGPALVVMVLLLADSWFTRQLVHEEHIARATKEVEPIIYGAKMRLYLTACDGFGVPVEACILAYGRGGN